MGGVDKSTTTWASDGGHQIFGSSQIALGTCWSLVVVTVSSWDSDMSLDMVVATNMAHVRFVG